jgi:outer membrane autotransporter protein
MKKIILAALAVVAFGAQAADEGAYAGLNYNHITLSGNGVTESDNTVGIYGGYRMGNIAGEISHLQKTITGIKVVVTDFSVIPRMTVAKDVDVLGKVGLRYSEATEGGFKFSGNSLVIGAGVEYTFMPQVTVRGMVDYSSKTAGESIKATTTSIGVAYKF